MLCFLLPSAFSVSICLFFFCFGFGFGFVLGMDDLFVQTRAVLRANSDGAVGKRELVNVVEVVA